jgi:hypothetical protein
MKTKPKKKDGSSTQSAGSTGGKVFRDTRYASRRKQVEYVTAKLRQGEDDIFGAS